MVGIIGKIVGILLALAITFFGARKAINVAAEKKAEVDTHIAKTETEDVETGETSDKEAAVEKVMGFMNSFMESSKARAERDLKLQQQVRDTNRRLEDVEKFIDAHRDSIEDLSGLERAKKRVEKMADPLPGEPEEESSREASPEEESSEPETDSEE